MLVNRKKRSKSELLTEEESARFLDLIKKNKISNSEIAKMVGIKHASSISPWKKLGIPACCRAYLQLLEMKKEIKLLLNKSTR